MSRDGDAVMKLASVVKKVDKLCTFGAENMRLPLDE
jgi:hypothetical protein